MSLHLVFYKIGIGILHEQKPEPVKSYDWQEACIQGGECMGLSWAAEADNKGLLTC